MFVSNTAFNTHWILKSTVLSSTWLLWLFTCPFNQHLVVERPSWCDPETPGDVSPCTPPNLITGNKVECELFRLNSVFKAIQERFSHTHTPCHGSRVWRPIQKTTAWRMSWDKCFLWTWREEVDRVVGLLTSSHCGRFGFLCLHMTQPSIPLMRAPTSSPGCSSRKQYAAAATTTVVIQRCDSTIHSWSLLVLRADAEYYRIHPLSSGSYLRW